MFGMGVRIAWLAWIWTSTDQSQLRSRGYLGWAWQRLWSALVQVATKVDEGVKQLLKAEKYQKATGMAMCIMFLVCAVIVMLIVYIFKIILLR